jgi:hypothetical protein
MKMERRYIPNRNWSNAKEIWNNLAVQIDIPKWHPKCKLSIFNAKTQAFEKFFCYDVRKLKKGWLEDFKNNNKCQENDRKYKEYLKEIDEFLDQCKCEK